MTIIDSSFSLAEAKKRLEACFERSDPTKRGGSGGSDGKKKKKSMKAVQAPITPSQVLRVLEKLRGE